MRYLLGILLFCLPVSALGWSTPDRGTATRAALMDALRPHAEWQLGAPVVFVVSDLRVQGDVAFGNLRATRAGGGEIDLYRTPDYRRGLIDPEYMDGPRYQALFRRSGDTWVAVHWALGATDAWWYNPEFCPLWQSVIPEVCG
ncbi:hypothetical protein ACOXXX_02945 [Thalassococcus sp. BH17M4-6]|uniref:hypothetical protein n=1 Tax=Thalassococcus sp. BH17M4-6 TaxID=3413148 RepID=UPI003BBB99A0